MEEAQSTLMHMDYILHTAIKPSHVCGGPEHLGQCESESEMMY